MNIKLEIISTKFFVDSWLMCNRFNASLKARFPCVDGIYCKRPVISD